MIKTGIKLSFMPVLRISSMFCVKVIFVIKILCDSCIKLRVSVLSADRLQVHIREAVGRASLCADLAAPAADYLISDVYGSTVELIHFHVHRKGLVKDKRTLEAGIKGKTWHEYAHFFDLFKRQTCFCEIVHTSLLENADIV